jgi:hypothetical protein
MSLCARCGATFGCAMAEGTGEPCWCTRLPPAVPVPPPGSATGCWCPACLERHLAQAAAPAPRTPAA